MKVKREKISEQMHLVAVADEKDLVITCAVFATEADADTAEELITALMKKTDVATKEKITGIRRYPFEPLVTSFRKMAFCGVGEPVAEII